MIMAQTAHGIVVFSAALGLLALTETAGDAAFSVESQLAVSQIGAPRGAPKVELRRGPDGSPVIVRANSSLDEDALSAYPPFTCAQLQVMDEAEFTGDTAAANACDDAD